MPRAHALCSRAGGRAHTLREPFTDGLHAEAGAMFVPASHDLVMQYVRLFGLRLVAIQVSRRLRLFSVA
ncbi:MAG TPA: FAD-dependent oxidoreductase [Pyrinomonadaceae bacterium]|nr:FAD-dependent oxidoreductase [Pyrinomonadaceae bacterium]